MGGCFKICCCFLLGLLSLLLSPFLFVVLVSWGLRVYKRGSILLTFGKPTLGGIEFFSITVRRRESDGIIFFCTMYRPTIRLYCSFEKQDIPGCIPKILLYVNCLEFGVVKEHNDMKKISLITPFKYKFFHPIFVWICRCLFSFVILKIEHMEFLMCLSESFLTKEPVKHGIIKENYEVRKEKIKEFL
jgi:hypothetical protein